jgi:formylmethanofuran dehydrogenase subunit E
MSNRTLIKSLLLLILLGCLVVSFSVAHTGKSSEKSEKNKEIVQSKPGENPWNQGHEPENWWAAVEQMHGHVGPWNVLGWRLGKSALKEFDSEWGHHELDIMVYLPASTPYTCIIDGIIMGTGNSMGRLDIRMADVMSRELMFVSVCRKDGSGPIVVYRPNQEYLKKIENRQVEDLEALSKECSKMKIEELFTIEKIQ